jgi:hypothetical protein
MASLSALRTLMRKTAKVRFPPELAMHYIHFGLKAIVGSVGGNGSFARNSDARD